MTEEDLLKDWPYELPDGKKAKTIILPGGRVIDFPFLMNVTVDALVINSDVEIVAYLFFTPQKIELETIICPEDLGYLKGEILVNSIKMSEEEQLYYIYLAQPIEIVTRLLGIIRVRILGVDANCNFVNFFRAEN